MIEDLLIEFDEMGFAPTTPCSDPEKYAIEWREKVRTEFEHLEAENAELKARLEKAEELPAKVGDRVFYINGFALDFAPAAVEEFEIEEILIQKSTTIFRLIGVDTGIKTVVFLSWYNKMWFTELEAAEARLAELKKIYNL